MRRCGGLLPRIVSWENFVLAAHKAALGKRDRPPIQEFFENFEINLSDLITQVNRGNLVLGEFTRFTIHDPKRREICAPSFKERVLHHALMNYCEPAFERRLIHDTYACRKGKGQQAALNSAMKCAARNRFFLKLDIRRFFDSIDHQVLYNQLSKLFREPGLLNLFGKIVQSYYKVPRKGLPIGALTSQHFANSYLAPLDRFIKERLRCRGYVRYMDDFVVWGQSSKDLMTVYTAIKEFLMDNLKLEVKAAFINRSQLGLDFLGYRVYPGWVRLSHRSKQRYARKLRNLVKSYEENMIGESKLQKHLESLTAFTRFAKSRTFRRRVLRKFMVEV